MESSIIKWKKTQEFPQQTLFERRLVQWQNVCVRVTPKDDTWTFETLLFQKKKSVTFGNLYFTSFGETQRY